MRHFTGLPTELSTESVDTLPQASNRAGSSPESEFLRTLRWAFGAYLPDSRAAAGTPFSRPGDPRFDTRPTPDASIEDFLRSCRMLLHLVFGTRRCLT